MKESRPRAATGPIACVLAVQSDERLVALFRAGHDAAFEVLVRRHRRPLLAYCRRFLPDSAGEDIVQHAFLSAYRALPETEGDLHFRAWLYRVASNRAIDVLRAGAPLDACPDEHFDRIAAPDAYDSRVRLAEVVSALQALPPRQRDALVLQELDGRNRQEIAARIGVTEGAVRQLVHRARAGLRAGVAALVPFGVVDALVRAPRAEAFVARRLSDFVGAGTGSAAAAKATVAVVSVVGLGGAATTTAVRAGDDRPERIERVSGAKVAIASSSAASPPSVSDRGVAPAPGGLARTRYGGRDRGPVARRGRLSAATAKAPLATADAPGATSDGPLATSDGPDAAGPGPADDRRSTDAPARQRPKVAAPEVSDDRDAAPERSPDQDEPEAPETSEPADEPAEREGDSESAPDDAPDIEAHEAYETDEIDPDGGAETK